MNQLARTVVVCASFIPSSKSFPLPLPTALRLPGHPPRLTLSPTVWSSAVKHASQACANQHVYSLATAHGLGNKCDLACLIIMDVRTSGQDSGSFLMDLNLDDTTLGLLKLPVPCHQILDLPGTAPWSLRMNATPRWAEPRERLTMILPEPSPQLLLKLDLS